MEEEREQHIFCNSLQTIASFCDIVKIKKHTKKINHIDFNKNLLMSSGDDDLILIIDLKTKKYINIIYDIINGTKYSFFLKELQPIIIYYGYKSNKLFIYDYEKENILYIVNLFSEELKHFEYSIKSNLLITTQYKDGYNSIVWRFEERCLRPYYNLKNAYYAIINSYEEQIIECSKIQEGYNFYTIINLYKYETKLNNSLIVKRFKELNNKIEYDIELMNTYKNYDSGYIILMSMFIIELISINKKEKCIKIELPEEQNLKFTYFEPVFTKEIIVGYNNGDVELLDPIRNKVRIDKNIQKKFDKEKILGELIYNIGNNVIRHETDVTQIKMSNYYPLYISISNEIIIHQLKEN